MITTDTKELINRLSNLAWFSKIGHASILLPVKMKVIPAGDAGKGLEDIKWQNFTLMLKNSLIGRLTEAAYNSSQINNFAKDLNAAAAEIESAYRSSIEGKILKSLPYVSKAIVERTVGKEVMCSLIETQFASLLRGQALYFREILLPIYLAGNLPCGWQGAQLKEGWRGTQLDDLPRGHLMVA